ncbi:hypothetical protein [Streptomyces albipurpureus]|uniref:Lipoprotein n=1 Tax=Streptomyces albipurpureus TaxID=2897419 RepID=A0ABT0UL26_9ACTN|nr:hypothetical protein [Streptomyces sp. CWNU-1]MCM2389307.1 hypothetical protein [Streptomyces sp. CWNU-1]
MTDQVRGARTKRTVAILAALLGVLTLGGCGIRPTQVPVDGGPAPSRVPCEVNGENITQQTAPQDAPVRVYLVCASQLEPVDRTAEIPETKTVDGRVQIAQALLAELQQEPTAAEREAGFATYVRGPIAVSGQRRSDPDGTLRLSRQPEDLPAAALAQIVCTFAESQASATGGAVILGGPGEYAPRGYGCTGKTKDRPEDVLPTVGPLPSPAPSRPSSSGNAQSSTSQSGTVAGWGAPSSAPGASGSDAQR